MDVHYPVVFTADDAQRQNHVYLCPCQLQKEQRGLGAENVQTDFPLVCVSAQSGGLALWPEDECKLSLSE